MSIRCLVAGDAGGRGGRGGGVGRGSRVGRGGGGCHELFLGKLSQLLTLRSGPQLLR